MSYENGEELAIGLHKRGAIKYADSKDTFWTLKSGRKSPVYVNLRGISSFSDSLPASIQEQIRTRQLVVEAYHNGIDEVGHYNHILGIPHALTCLAGLVAQEGVFSVLSMRSGEKNYGAHKTIEGDFEEGDVVVALDDVVTDGASKLETVEAVRAEGLQLRDTVVLIDREEGGREALHTANINLISVLGLASVTSMLRQNHLVSEQQTEWMREYYNNLVTTGLIVTQPIIESE